MGMPTNKLVLCAFLSLTLFANNPFNVVVLSLTLFANNPFNVVVSAEASDKDFTIGVVVAGIVIAAALSVSGDKDARLLGASAPPIAAGGVDDGEGVVVATTGGDDQPAAMGDDDIRCCA
jgi:hypothetical protein